MISLTDYNFWNQGGEWSVDVRNSGHSIGLLTYPHVIRNFLIIFEVFIVWKRLQGLWLFSMVQPVKHLFAFSKRFCLVILLMCWPCCKTRELYWMLLRTVRRMVALATPNSQLMNWNFSLRSWFSICCALATNSGVPTFSERKADLLCFTKTFSKSSKSDNFS